MKTILTTVYLSFYLFAANVQASETWTNPSTSVVSLFACNVNPGKTREDVWRVVERNTEAQRSIKPYSGNSFVWFPMRGRTGFDYMMGFIGKDLVTSVDNLERYIAGPGQKMGPEFAALGKCVSGIYESTSVRGGKVKTGDDRKLDAVVELYSCNTKASTKPGDMDAAVKLWNQGVDKVQSKVMREEYDAVISRPLWGGFADHDFLWVGNFPDLRGLAESSGAMMANADARRGLDALTSLSDCESSLWSAYWLLGPAK